MGSTATATREVFYLVEQPGRFLFKAGATDDWETAAEALSAGPAWRTCIVVRVNDADQLCRLIGRKYSDRLHGDSGWLALMPDQIQSVRSYALKAGDDFRRANPDRPAASPKQPRKTKKAPASSERKPAEPRTPESMQDQPADGPSWGQKQARQAANDPRARADAHWHSSAAKPAPEPAKQTEAQPEPAAGPAPAETYPLWKALLSLLLIAGSAPLLSILILVAHSLFATPTPAPAAANSTTTEQAMAAIDSLRSKARAEDQHQAKANWERLQLEKKRNLARQRAKQSAGEQLLAELKERSTARREEAVRASSESHKWDPAKSFAEWEQNCVSPGQFILHSEDCMKQRREFMAHADTRAQVFEAEYQECKSNNQSGRDCSKP